MNSTPSQCNPEIIHRFLLDSLNQEEAQSLEAHLSTCQLCQQTFESKLALVTLDEDRSSWLRESPLLDPTHDLPAANVDAQAWDRESILEISKRLLPPSDNPAMIGRLGEFEILEPLGAGGMGIVYKGYDHELNRYVAVKVLSPSLSISGAAKQRFLREAQAAAAVVHPHVVPIHAVSSDSQIPYLVMSYVPGENLQEYLTRQGALPLQEALRIAHQVALGLSVAHDHGVIHRDVKPGNVLLERNVQRALLTDFGLARAADDASLTHSGMLAGTPNYMSPEQARGEPIDARSDLFSLGSILYAMLAGHPPFRGEHAYVVLRRLVDDTPRSLSEIQPQLPTWVDRLVGRMLAKDRDMRFQSAQEVASILQACQLHVEQPSQHPLPIELMLPKGNAKQKSILILVVVALLLAASLGWYSWSLFHVTKSNTTEDATEVVSEQEEARIAELIQTWREQDREVSKELLGIQAAVDRLEAESRLLSEDRDTISE